MTDSLTDIPGAVPSSHSAPVVRDRSRFIDRFDRRIVNVLTVLGFAVPVVAYFWLVHRYSVNVVVGDQWDDVTVIRRSYSNLFDWNLLWAQHAEHRIFFPNLLVIFLSRTTHFNIQFEEYLSAFMLALATALIIWAHKRRSPSTPWLYYCPVALLTFSFVQFGNTLWGFQMCWYLVLLALATAIVVLDRVTLGWLTFIGAVAAGVVGSFSLLQGLFIWPAGLVLLLIRRRAWPFIAAWVVAGLASVALYFHNFNFATVPSVRTYTLDHPLYAAKFFLYTVGDVVGVQQPPGEPPNGFVLFIGLLMVVLAVATLVLYGIRRDSRSGSPVGVALICVGLLFAVSITQSRVVFGYAAGAGASRYTTFDLLIPVGIYLTLLGRPALSSLRRPKTIGPRSGLSDGSGLEKGEPGFPRWIDAIVLPVIRIAIVSIIATQVVFGFQNGLTGAKASYSFQSQAAHVLQNINHTADSQVKYWLYIYKPASYIRSQARTAEKHHLSLFDYGRPPP